MKRLLSAAVAAAIGLAVAPVAAQQPLASVDRMKSGDTWQLVFGSASATGTYFAGMSALAAVLSEKMPNVRATATVSPGSAVEVFPQLMRAERAGGMHTSYDIDIGYRGVSTFKGRDIPIRNWFFAQEAVYNVFILKKRNITSIPQLKGSGLRFGGAVVPIDQNRPERWDNAFAFFHALMTAHGIDPFKDVTMLPYNTSQSIEQLGSANIDGLSASRALGSGAISELSTKQDLYVLQPDPATVKKVEAAFPVYAQPYAKDAYPKIEVPAPGLGFFHGVYAVLHRDLPDDLVYQMTKVLWDNIDVMRNAHPSFKVAKLETALKGTEVPPHPGALRFYVEKNVEGAKAWAEKLAKAKKS
ncbi:C4-dicarboxylate ABC transporter [Allostella sp. ATCC 35155]|nr:C4-dicarboxylate ABC transporter [Stella sp. ATCC 35155]